MYALSMLGLSQEEAERSAAALTKTKETTVNPHIYPLEKIPPAEANIRF